MDEEARVRTEKTGRIGHEAVTEATYVFDRTGLAPPAVLRLLLLFRQRPERRMSSLPLRGKGDRDSGG